MFLSKLKSSFLESYYLIDPKWQTLISIADYSAIWAILFAFYSFSDPRLSCKGNMVAIIACSVCISLTAALLPESLGVKIFHVTGPVTIMASLYFTHYVKFSHLPQLVAFYHALVGMGAWAIEILNIYSHFDHGLKMGFIDKTITIVGTIIACITITGSLVAAAKLHGLDVPRPLSVHGESNLLLGLISFLICLIPLCCYLSTSQGLFISSLIMGSVAALSFGFLLINAIDGSNMPVMMSLLNATSGITTLAAGVSLENTLLITIGAYIAATGTILSQVMCKGMNRTLTSLLIEPLFRVERCVQYREKENEASDRFIRIANEFQQIYTFDLLQELYKADSILIVPGYGLATAKAHFVLGNLINHLTAYDRKVGVVIHPVAGRMPGHLNVLLAEASVPYSLVYDLDAIKTNEWDLALVIGANDIVNPSALEPGSQSYGMPLVTVWECKKTVVIKRSMATGFAGINNPLFHYPATSMLFKDAKEALVDIEGSLQSIFGTRSKLSHVRDTGAYKKFIEDIKRKNERSARKVENQTNEAALSVGLILENSENFLLPVTNVNINEIARMNVSIAVTKECFNEYVDLLTGFPNIKVAKDMNELLKASNVIICAGVKEITSIDFKSLNDKQLLVYDSQSNHHTAAHAEVYENSGAVAIDMARVPRHTAAQAFDLRSASANLRGYRALLSAFYTFDGFAFSATTASASLDSAVVLVVGCGIAGLQAIRASKSLGATVFGHDSRVAAKSEVESLGAQFISLTNESRQTANGYALEMSDAFKAKQGDMLVEFLPFVDVLILTAQLPNKPSPQLIPSDLVRLMKPTSVIVDLGINTPQVAESSGWGGNCELSKYDSIHQTAEGQRIIAYKDFAMHSPAMFETIKSHTYTSLIKQILHDRIFDKDKNLTINSSQLLQAMTATPINLMEQPKIELIQEKHAKESKIEVVTSDEFTFTLNLMFIIGFLTILVSVANIHIVRSLNSLGMGLIIGSAVVWVVNPKLHTPLMSFTNAISGIIVVGSFSFLQRESFIYMVLAQLSIICNLINLVGGFYITTRMLSVFDAST